MTKKISRKYILASGIATACLLAAAPSFADAKVGVTSAVNPDAVGQPPSAQERVLFVGVDMQADERVRTAEKGQVQLLFLDGSALSIGPNSDMVIDKFVYDPEKKVGELGFSAARGVFRLVGGRISKNSEVEFKTPTATIGIRGGIALIRVLDNGSVSATFLFGQRMRVTSGGTTTSTTRPATIDAPADGPPSGPRPISEGELSTALPLLEGTTGDDGGSEEPTEDRRLADSGFVGTGREAEAETEAESAASEGPATEDEPTAEVPDAGVPDDEGEALPGRTFVGRAVLEPWGGAFDPETLLLTRDPENAMGVSATVAGETLEVSADGDVLVLPYRPGEEFDFSEADTNLDEPLYGWATIHEHSFTYQLYPESHSTMVETTDGVALPGPVLIYGGDQTAAGALPTSGVGAYYYNGHGVPFSASFFAPHPELPYATVSPLYALWQSSGRSPTLQASFAISGQGTTQQSSFSGHVGSFFNEQGSDMPALGGFAFGSDRSLADWEQSRTINGVASAPLDTGTAIYGPTGEEVMVIPDLMDYTATGYVRQDALGLRTNGLFEYPIWLAQTHVRGETPTGVGASATANVFHGYSAGMLEVLYTDPYFGEPVLEYSRFVSNDPSTEDGMGPGGLVVSTDPTTRTVAATAGIYTFDGYIGDGDVVVELGGHGAEDANRSTMIDDKIFGAIDSASRPVQIDGEARGHSELFMVTHETVANDNWQPSFVELCECSYLKWGWWAGTVHEETEDVQASAHLATWVAGHLWGVDVPLGGTATYNGHVIGNVRRDVDGVGYSYVAAGSFRGDWDFAARQGAVTIDNFDGMDFAGSASSWNGRDFYGAFAEEGAAPRVVGELEGSFFVDPAAAAGAVPAHMAGQFIMENVVGQPAYSAAGTFAAQTVGEGP